MWMAYTSQCVNCTTTDCTFRLTLSVLQQYLSCVLALFVLPRHTQASPELHQPHQRHCMHLPMYLGPQLHRPGLYFRLALLAIRNQQIHAVSCLMSRVSCLMSHASPPPLHDRVVPAVGFCRTRQCEDFSPDECMNNSTCSYVGDNTQNYDFVCYTAGNAPFDTNVFIPHASP
jgi:hypothetical protein